jgi:hypothetical protein
MPRFVIDPLDARDTNRAFRKLGVAPPRRCGQCGVLVADHARECDHCGVYLFANRRIDD